MGPAFLASWSSNTIGMFALLVVFACVEKLCSIMNLVAVEKDWVRYFSAFGYQHLMGESIN